MNIDCIQKLTSCPLCHNGLENTAEVTDKDTFNIHCGACGTYEITEECMVFTDMTAKLRQGAEKLSKWVQKMNDKGEKWPMIKMDIL